MSRARQFAEAAGGNMRPEDRRGRGALLPRVNAILEGRDPDAEVAQALPQVDQLAPVP